ncbi:response regulator [Sphingomonas endolithica]|uniref:response regulator n=1 Tax=Sphingomonas endolithica TaxID=2972485 RepID=UPI0021B05496|nr:response regulator [Sphingomonas sp. ZFBP2030]
MADRSLQACRILVVEDEYLLADELAQELTDAGAEVLGPAPTIELALQALKEGPAPDGAILDVNLSGVSVFPLADTLIERGVPVVFTTGYDPDSFPVRFANVPKCNKPINISRITAAIGRAIHP